MGVRDFAIATNHPFNKYRSGQRVKGKVHFTLDEPKKIRGVYVKIKGLAQVSWNESKTSSSGGKSRTTSVRYHGEHEYFNDRIYFIGEDGGDSLILPPADYDYKFDYDLPMGLPTTYKDTYGYVRYTITGVLDIPWGFDDEEEIELDVTTPVDLNTTPHLNSAFHIKRTKHLCCFWCRAGPLNIEINLPKTAYTYGELIPITIDVENLTNASIDSIDCKLTQQVTFHSQVPSHHTRESTDTLCQIVCSRLPARSSNSYSKNLSIPMTRCLNFDNCSVLDIYHELKIEANISGCHLNLSVKIPITLGSIPFLRQEGAVKEFALAGLGIPYPYEEGDESNDLVRPGAPNLSDEWVVI